MNTMRAQIDHTYKQMIVDGGKEMIDKGLTVGTWGNLSVRDPETGLIYVKPSGIRYHDITPEDVVVFTPDGTKVDGNRKPTIEYPFHLGIMNARADVNFVIHTHPTYSAVLGVLGKDLPGICEDFVQLVGDRIINCKYSLPGSTELAQNVVEALGDRNAVMIPNHGTICCGSSWDMVMKVCYVVEKTAHIYILASSIGTPNLISDEDILAMQHFARNHYGQGK